MTPTKRSLMKTSGGSTPHVLRAEVRDLLGTFGGGRVARKAG
jgi:hypothetical protein